MLWLQHKSLQNWKPLLLKIQLAGVIYTWLYLFIFILFLCYGITYLQKNKKYISPKTTDMVLNIGLCAIISMLLGGIIIAIIKVIVGRYRPSYLFEQQIYRCILFNIKNSDCSFPSGHTQITWAAMTTFALFFPRQKIIFLAFGTLVGLCRIVLKAHFISDVIMGAFVGMIVTLYVHAFLTQKGYLKNDKTNSSKNKHSPITQKPLENL